MSNLYCSVVYLCNILYILDRTSNGNEYSVPDIEACKVHSGRERNKDERAAEDQWCKGLDSSGHVVNKRIRPLLLDRHIFFPSRLFIFYAKIFACYSVFILFPFLYE